MSDPAAPSDAVEPPRSSGPGDDGADASQPANGTGPIWRLVGIVKTMRPHQWVKNLFVLAPAVFAKDIFDREHLVRAFGALGVFCLLASAVYTLNDLVDVEADRVHPLKRHRPIASGRVPVRVARATCASLVLVSVAGAFYGPLAFAATAIAYFALNVAYSLRLKKAAYVDVGCIAFGFVLRVLAGGYATRIHVSWYLVACTALLALFLGFGKRRHELAQAARNAARQRAALQAYSPRALTVALALTGVATTASYVAYTLDPATRAFFRSDWLWLTALNPVYGLYRFLRLMTGRPKAESPTQEMLRDVPFVLNLVIWAVVVMAIVYRLRPAVLP
jgi:4-hydroxybenzoate polyprenyltransferase